MSPSDPRWPDWFAIEYQSGLRSMMYWRKNVGRELRKLYCKYQQLRIAEVSVRRRELLQWVDVYQSRGVLRRPQVVA